MKIASSAELKHYVEPLLCGTEVSAESAFLAATFSQLCEPGDRSFSVLEEQLGGHRLLEALVERHSSAQLADSLEAFSIQEVELAFEQSFEQIWQAACERWLPRLIRADLLASLDQAKSLNAHLVTRESDFYPAGLHDLASGKPPLLWVLGDPSVLARPNMVSVVGSRNTSPYGRGVAGDLGVVAADNQIVTVSGGAHGIDACVHQATIQAGGQTVAAMAGGIGRLYPAANRELLLSVAATGAVISEVPPSVAPAKWRFLMRNRMIAAMGKATIVVQAGHRSGSINTANTAVQLERRVAVVPGQVNSVYSMGCHNFLNDNLGMVELLASAQMLPELMGGNQQGAALLAGLGALETRALDAFASGVNQFDSLLKEAGLTSSEAMLALGNLQLDGLVERVGSGYRKVAQ